MSGRPELKRWVMIALCALALAGLMLVAVFAAWLCDDYYFSLKPAWNLIQGHGLRHNVAERVQGFSNPLWTLLLAGNFVVQDVHHTSTLAMSMGLTLGAALLFAFRAAPTPTGAILGLVILAASKSFIDYTSSGLENPLAHLLYLGFLTVWFSAANPARRPMSTSLLRCRRAYLWRCGRSALVGVYLGVGGTSEMPGVMSLR